MEPCSQFCNMVNSYMYYTMSIPILGGEGEVLILEKKKGDVEEKATFGTFEKLHVFAGFEGINVIEGKT